MAKLQVANVTTFIASRNLGTSDKLITLSEDTSLKKKAKVCCNLSYRLNKSLSDLYFPLPYSFLTFYPFIFDDSFFKASANLLGNEVGRSSKSN